MPHNIYHYRQRQQQHSHAVDRHTVATAGAKEHNMLSLAVSPSYVSILPRAYASKFRLPNPPNAFTIYLIDLSLTLPWRSFTPSSMSRLALENWQNMDQGTKAFYRRHADHARKELRRFADLIDSTEGRTFECSASLNSMSACSTPSTTFSEMDMLNETAPQSPLSCEAELPHGLLTPPFTPLPLDSDLESSVTVPGAPRRAFLPLPSLEDLEATNVKDPPWYDGPNDAWVLGLTGMC
ncbi:hypothetical protein K439DRAFT_633316 [Ramaria rubella]|nr:hypothetical protein K439DRAFT_633316 [Ramaria rubella]